MMELEDLIKELQKLLIAIMKITKNAIIIFCARIVNLNILRWIS
mgnify:CR=1 FL=1